MGNDGVAHLLAERGGVGRLQAVGTANNIITMDAKNALWRGLQFFDGTGSINHASLANGGSQSFGANQRSMVTIVTANGQTAPSSQVDFGPNIGLAGTDFDIAASSHSGDDQDRQEDGATNDFDPWSSEITTAVVGSDYDLSSHFSLSASHTGSTDAVTAVSTVRLG